MLNAFQIRRSAAWRSRAFFSGIDRIRMLLADTPKPARGRRFPIEPQAQDLLMQRPGDGSAREAEGWHIRLDLPRRELPEVEKTALPGVSARFLHIITYEPAGAMIGTWLPLGSFSLDDKRGAWRALRFRGGHVWLCVVGANRPRRPRSRHTSALYDVLGNCPE